MAQTFFTTNHFCGTCGARQEERFSAARAEMSPVSDGRYFVHIDRDGDAVAETCERAAAIARSTGVALAMSKTEIKR